MDSDDLLVKEKVPAIVPSPFKGRARVGIRRQLRNNPTEPEKRFWSWVRKKQLGVKFRRQHSISQYIVDFYCAEARLVIELDGDSHYTQEALINDRVRDQYLHTVGLTVLRFTNQQVMREKMAVLTVVMATLAKRKVKLNP